MDDLKFGKRNKRGDWDPFERVTPAPLFVLPPRPVALLKWVFGWDGYVWPWNFTYALIGVAIWFWATPSLTTVQILAPGWIGLILLRNAALIGAVYGFLHLRLYIRKSQGNLFKYNHRWPSKDNDAFMFKDQTRDNMFWTLVSGLPIWTAYEVGMLWAMANGWVPVLDPAAQPILFGLVLFLIPLWREFHFYWVHRMIHWPPLYKYVHSLHHANVNPGPWSGLSMHPVEHALYFSSVLIHLIVPSHPIHVLFHQVHVGLSPAQGHTGFDKIVAGDQALNTHAFAHYLHHKYFEVNYADGAIPLDKWFGSFHDGSPESDVVMDARLAKRREAMQAKS
jgi:sterol desaturase/sphingolipid hydroxylase (fatty acid hydroxylase superfamily)